MKRLTQKEAIRLHKEMWDWIAKTGKSKWDYFHEMKKENSYDIRGACYLCEYYEQRREKAEKYYCGRCCLLVWPGDNCMSNSSPFTDIFEKSPEEIKRLAAIIRDLPINKKKP